MLQTNADFTGKNVPIQFWGKIVDQDDAPLSGVAIKARIRGWSGSTRLNIEGHFTKKEAVSGADGRFMIGNASGDVLTIEALEKEGYEPEPSALRSFGYNISVNIHPDPQNPVILRMWRATTKAKLITGDKLFSIIPDGRVYTIDLIKRIKVESATAEGDLRISIKRPPDVKFGDKYDWSFSLEPVDGGLVEETDPYALMYIAPSDGYAKDLRMTRNASQKPWGHAAQKRFYLKSRGGQVYGRLRIEVFAFYDMDKRDGSLDIQWSINPDGSRNLR